MTLAKSRLSTGVDAMMIPRFSSRLDSWSAYNAPAYKSDFRDIPSPDLDRNKVPFQDVKNCCPKFTNRNLGYSQVMSSLETWIKTVLTMEHAAVLTQVSNTIGQRKLWIGLAHRVPSPKITLVAAFVRESI